MDGEKMKIAQISEKEFHVGGNKASLIEGNIIHVIVQGEQTAESSILQIEVNNKLASLVNGKINYLIDLNKSGRNSPEARAAWKRASEDENVIKVAVFGLNPVARVLASFVMGVTKKKDIHFFMTKEDAYRWLTAEGPKDKHK
jgi:hypothetical protein